MEAIATELVTSLESGHFYGNCYQKENSAKLFGIIKSVLSSCFLDYANVTILNGL